MAGVRFKVGSVFTFSIIYCYDFLSALYFCNKKWHPKAAGWRHNFLCPREQYENAWKQLQDVRNNVERLRKEHIRLTDEASNIRVETHEYMNYMEKKTSKRQNMIVSLNDQNQKEIEKIKVNLLDRNWNLFKG